MHLVRRYFASLGSTNGDVLNLRATMAESGLPEFVLVNWWGVLAPAGTPPDIVGRLNGEIVKVLQLPEVRERIAAEGGEPSPNSPEQFAKFIAAEVVKWGALVRASGAQVD